MSREEFIMPDERLLPEYTADGHLEEGTVHTWLDGVFDADAAAAVSAHVNGCAACMALVAEARGLLAGSSRILAALDVTPAGVVPAEDASRTAARIAASVPMSQPKRTTAKTRRIQPWWYSAAAAAVLVVGVGGTMWMRGGKELAERPVADTAREVREPAFDAATQAAGAAGAAVAINAPASDAATVDAPKANAKVSSIDPNAPVSSTPANPGVVAPVPMATPMAAPSAARRALGASQNVAQGMSQPGSPGSGVAASTTAVPPSVSPAPAPASVQAAELRAPALARTVAAEPEVASASSATRRVTVTGTVTDAAARQPVADAVVEIFRGNGAALRSAASTKTDATGYFSVTADSITANSIVTVRVRRIGYEVSALSRLVQSDTLRVAFALKQAGFALSEVVTTGAPERRAANTRTRESAKAGQGAAVAQNASTPTPPMVTTAQAEPARRAMAAASIAVAADAVSRPPRPYPGQPGNREQYDRIEDNPFLGVTNNPLSTFSIDVDRASYGNVRRFLQSGQRPPADAVRIEELINYFPYELREPRGNDPVAITTEVTTAPWQPRHQLVRIALQSKRIEMGSLPPNNLVFLIDVSGSMQSPDKLPLVKQSLRLLVDQMRPQDRVAIVTYAGAAGLVLPSTSGDEKESIIQAIERLEAGGSTAGGAGIELAYRTAREHFMDHGNNRVILASDGDFNVGVSSDGELERLIERKRTEGTYLTILGFGTGNYQDAKMEKLAKRGNGNYAYIDELAEARKMLVREMGATLLTVANDVKLQVEFNPRRVQAYRLIGYEDRLLRNEDFTDDRKDAGDLGAGHQVTALYEIVPVGVQGTVTLQDTEARRYEPVTGEARSSTSSSDELLFVKLRYKRPGESTSRLMTHPVPARVVRGSDDMRFASSVAAFGMLLRESPYAGNTSAAQVLEQARAALGEDDGGYRAEFIRLVERYRRISAGGQR
ncbi:MAG TPA: von Willebrand factor type A domain-containing protein [Gemmatimonas sp.]|uniref:YfbK domain-containing protein n=1 Tax=Gemmatimonas sp. TaxID=1962908 RepID=UPI002ED7E0BC